MILFGCRFLCWPVGLHYLYFLGSFSSGGFDLGIYVMLVLHSFIMLFMVESSSGHFAWVHSKITFSALFILITLCGVLLINDIFLWIFVAVDLHKIDQI